MTEIKPEDLLEYDDNNPALTPKIVVSPKEKEAILAFCPALKAQEKIRLKPRTRPRKD